MTRKTKYEFVENEIPKAMETTTPPPRENGIDTNVEKNAMEREDREPIKSDATEIDDMAPNLFQPTPFEPNMQVIGKIEEEKIDPDRLVTAHIHLTCPSNMEELECNFILDQIKLKIRDVLKPYPNLITGEEGQVEQIFEL